MTRTAQRSLICSLILAGLAGCSGGDLTADPTAAGTAAAAATDVSKAFPGAAIAARDDAAGAEKATAGTWSRIGYEWDTLTVPANTTVRYGANGTYLEKIVSGTFTATNAFFGGDPAPGVRKQVELFTPEAAATTTTTTTTGNWSFLAYEWSTLTVPANSTVRYGANGAYVQRVVSGTFTATNAFFGADPAPGVRKQVELLTTSTSSAAPATTTAAASGRVIRVGPGQAVTRIADAAAMAQDGDTIEIQAGTYWGDVAIWRRNNLTIRGVGGRPVLNANGTSAQGKGIFVVSGANVTVDNLEFVNAKVPDKNGAGIRFEGGNLIVRNTVFRDNEQGILTVSNATSSLEIYNSQFIGNAFAYSGGYSHAIYVNQIGRFVVQGSYFTRTQMGHLIKSRARENHIAYNRITDEAGGSASYEINLPNGGQTYLIGNLIEQGANTGNPAIVSYGEEGMGVWPSNQFHAANNTVVNRRGAGCTWMRVPAGATAKVTNNLLLGSNCRLELPAGSQVSNNPVVTDADFANPSAYDFRLRAGSAARGAWVNPGSANGVSLVPGRQYVHPANSTALSQPASNPGAMQSVL